MTEPEQAPELYPLTNIIVNTQRTQSHQSSMQANLNLINIDLLDNSSVRVYVSNYSPGDLPSAADHSVV